MNAFACGGSSLGNKSKDSDIEVSANAFANRKVAFMVNSKSGGKGGAALLQRLQDLASVDTFFGEQRQVFDLMKFASEQDVQNQSLKEFFSEQVVQPEIEEVKIEAEKARDSPAKHYVIIAGGDGTIKWVVEILSKLNLPEEQFPKIALIPMGTANELARVTGWRRDSNPSSFNLRKFLVWLFTAKDITLDQWQYDFHSNDGDESKSQQVKMICFASLGIDAKIAYKFHLMRESHPSAADTVLKNKWWYFYYGLKRTFSKHSKLPEKISVEIEGEKVELPANAQSLQIFNISTAGDGIYFWGKQKSSKDELQHWTQPALNDGLLEIASLDNVMHIIGTKLTALHSHRLAQSRDIQVTVQNHPVVIQIDGECWVLQNGVLKISFDRKIPIVKGPASTFNIGEVDENAKVIEA